MIFGRKKKEKPKSMLGLALYRYDSVFNNRIKDIIKLISVKRKLNAKKIDKILTNAFNEMDIIVDNVSRDNFKTDYRSDKIRDDITKLVQLLKDNLTSAGSLRYNHEEIKTTSILHQLNKVPPLRQEISKKMKDIESDYN